MSEATFPEISVVSVISVLFCNSITLSGHYGNGVLYYGNKQKRRKHYGNVFVNFEIFVVFGMKYHDVDNSEKERKDEKNENLLVSSVIFVIIS